MDEPDAPGITADLTYLAPGSFINRRFVAPAREVNTGEYRPYSVTIRDARPRQAAFTLAGHGFELRTHRSAVRDFLRRVRPWRVPHTAFRDTSRPHATPRASIEFRSVAYFP
jgi:hypothetical protein